MKTIKVMRDGRPATDEELKCAMSGQPLPPQIAPSFRVRITRLSVLPLKEPLFSERCTNVSIVDEGAGEFLEIEQQSGRADVKSQTIILDPEEWPFLKQAIEKLITECEQ